MTRDPWAVDWEDDWTKAAKESKSSEEIWSQANSQTEGVVPSTEIASVAPTIAYRPQVKILKRDSAVPATRESSKEVKHVLDAAERESRYKEARERLFGTPEPAPLAAPLRRGASPANSDAKGLVRPERQARGPPDNGVRGGFSGRGRGNGQAQRMQ